MSQQDVLIENLKAGWISVPALLAVMHWKAPTLRGAISSLGRKRGFKIERRREDGVTSYRIAPQGLADVA